MNLRLASICVVVPASLLVSCGQGAGTEGMGGSGGASTSSGTSSASGSSTGGASSAQSSSSSGGLTCTPPTGDCDLDPGNGCETDLSKDPQNCGKCGNTCVGGPCQGGGCVLAQPGGSLTYNFGDRQCLDVDATNVYFPAINLSSSGPSGVLYVPQAGGAVKVLAGGAMTAVGVAVSGGLVYWTDAGAGKILVTPAPGQSGSTKTLVSGLTQPVRLAVDATNVYWTAQSGVGAADKTTGQIKWTFNSTGGSPWAIAVDATNVYYTDPPNNAVVQVPIATGQGKVIASSQQGARGLALDANRVYWTTPKSGDIVASSKVVIAALSILSGQNNPWELAIDRTQTPNELYWTNSAMNGDVSKAPITGGTATVVAPSQTWGMCVATDPTSVYWMVAMGSAILKAPK